MSKDQTMKMYETTQSVDKYLNVRLECDCGMVHYAPIRAVNISKGALASLPQYAGEFGYKAPYIICDKITYSIAGEKCESLLREAGFDVTSHVLKHTGFDEATLGEIVINKPNNCDLMIGVGTGSITDMLRYASYKLDLPCFTVATGAPMDGFSASAGIMNVNNLKATMAAHSTEVIIADTDILATAPYRMTVAGYADLMGKLNAINDWYLDVLINNCHYCKKIDSMVMDYVYDILPKTDAIKARDSQALGDLMNALLLTGASITLYGNSRPISGAEHHMSHLWEAIGDQRGKAFAMHGEQVAVGTVLSLRFAEILSNMQIDFDKARQTASRYDQSEWENEIRRVFGTAADAIIDLEKESGKNNTEQCLARIDTIEKKYPEIREVLKKEYDSSALRASFEQIGCPCDPKDIGVDAELLKDTFLYAKETRARYTVFQLAWDLGVLKEIADKIIDELKQDNRI